MTPQKALFDHLTFSLRAELRGMPTGGLEHMLGRFEQRGWRPARDGRRVGLRIPLLGGACEMAASLLLTERAEQDGTATVLITSGSTASLNGMRLLRADLGGAAAAWESLDGEDNLIGPFDADAGPLLPRQLRLVADALEALREGIDDGLVGEAGAVLQELRLGAAELVVDSAHPGARPFVFDLGRCAMPGSWRVVNDNYRTSLEGGSAASVRWYDGRANAYAKVYAKGDGLLRVEVVLADRPALRALGSGVREVGGPEAVELLDGLSGLAEGKLGRALDHVVAARSGFRPLVLLVSELRPLEELALGVGEGAGRKPGREAREGASLAFSALVTTGNYCGRNLRKRTALRTVLDDLSKGDGPLQCERGCLYTVRPLNTPLATKREAWEGAQAA